MTETTTITFEVPTETLRKARFVWSADAHREAAESSGDPRTVILNLASASWVEAQQTLPPPRKPVTKDTAWNTPIVSAEGTTATFIGPHPANPRRFIALVYGTLLPLRYDWWFEAEPEPKDEPESVRVPVEVGQKRRHPNTGEVFTALELREGKLTGEAWRVRGGDGYTMRVHEPLLEQWEIVE